MASKKKSKPESKPATPAPGKPGPKKDGPNKSDFIRTMPTQPAGEVVAAAAAKGITITAGLVYAVRSASKGKTPGASKGKPGRPKASASVSSIGGPSDDVLNLIQAIKRVGLATAETILQVLKAK